MPTFEQEYYEYDGFWNAPLSEADQVRAGEVFSLIPAPVASIADIGCGNGVFCNYVRRANPNLKIVGFDRSKAALKYVQTEKISGSMDDLPFVDRAFDCVVSLEVIEHLPVPLYEKALAEMARVAKDYLVVSVPNSQRLGEGQTQCMTCKTWFDPDLHLRSFDRSKMQTLFSSLGFVCKSVKELGCYSAYRGFKTYYAWCQPKQAAAMQSPLCPVCGFVNKDYLNQNQLQPTVLTPAPKQASSIAVSPLKRWLKQLWPKRHGAYWLVAVYERAD